MFCGKYYIRIDKYVFIIVKIKCVNLDRINDICDKVNFIIKLHTFYMTDILSKHTIFDILYETVQCIVHIHYYCTSFSPFFNNDYCIEYKIRSFQPPHRGNKFGS